MGNQVPSWEGLATNPWKREEILVTVKAYPHPSKKYIETVCVAGVTRSRQWMRLYPIRFRYLEYDQRFPAYSWISANIRKSSKDTRPESHNIDIDTLQIVGSIGTEDSWQARRSLLLPLASPSVEILQEQQQLSKTSLGLIRPKQIKRLIIQQKKDAHWTEEELAKLQRRSMLDEMESEDRRLIVRELEKIPYDFFYEFTCADPRCRGHKIKIISWEVMESYRKWFQDYGARWEDAFRGRYEQEFLDPKQHDLHFFMGNMAAHPQNWLIIGLFYPTSQPGDAIQPSLFE